MGNGCLGTGNCKSFLGNLTELRPYVGAHVGVACVGVLGQVLVPQPPSRGPSAAVTGVQVSRAVAAGATGPFGRLGSRPEHGDLVLVRTGYRAIRMPRTGHVQPIDVELLSDFGHLAWQVIQEIDQKIRDLPRMDVTN